MTNSLLALVLLAQVAHADARVGFQVDRRGTALVISQVDATSSAATLVKIGDQVLRIDLESTEKMTAETAARFLSGSLHSKLTLLILPRGGLTAKRVTVERDVRLSTSPVHLGGGSIHIADRSNSPPDIRVTLERADRRGGGESLQEALEAFDTQVAACIHASAVQTTALRAALTMSIPPQVRTENGSGTLDKCLSERAAGWGLPAEKAPYILDLLWGVKQ